MKVIAPIVFLMAFHMKGLSAEELTRSFFSAGKRSGHLIKVFEHQIKIQLTLKDGDHLCQRNYFRPFFQKPIYLSFKQKKKEIALTLNQFTGENQKGLGCIVNGNVNCRKLIYKGSYLKCLLAYTLPGKDVIQSIKLDFDGKIKFDEQLSKMQNLKTQEFCNTFLKYPTAYKREIKKFQDSLGINYFHSLNSENKKNEIYYVYMGCGASVYRKKTGLCDVAILDMGRPINKKENCKKAFASKEGITCRQEKKDILLPYQYCLGAHLALQDYNSNPRNTNVKVAGPRKNLLPFVNDEVQEKAPLKTSTQKKIRPKR